MPLPADNPTEARYQGAAGRRYQEGKRAVPPAAFPWVARHRAEKIAPHVRATDVVVEFGVGYGWNLAALNCAGRIGFDLTESLEPALLGLDLTFVREAAALDAASADVVICHHLLEHVLHPAATLADISRVLKPGGKLLLFVPFEKELRYRRHDAAEPNHHLYSWNAQTLGNLVGDCGFRLVSSGLGQFGYDRAAATWAAKLRVGETGFRCLRTLAHLVFPACEVRVVAEKPAAHSREQL